MMSTRCRSSTISRRTLTAALGLLLTRRAWAASLPDEVTLVVPFPAGANESAARTLGSQLGKITKATFAVDVRAGQNGNIAALFVARAKPDGSTWLLGPASILTVNPILYGVR